MFYANYKGHGILNEMCFVSDLNGPDGIFWPQINDKQKRKLNTYVSITGDETMDQTVLSSARMTKMSYDQNLNLVIAK